MWRLKASIPVIGTIVFLVLFFLAGYKLFGAPDCANTITKKIAIWNSQRVRIQSNGPIEDDLIYLLEHCQNDTYEIIIWTPKHHYKMIVTKEFNKAHENYKKISTE